MSAIGQKHGTRRPRIAVQILFYDCEQFILRVIANCAPFAEKIYVSYSPLPWGYNPRARELFKNRSRPEVLKDSPYWSKIDLVEGDWLTEEEQRNEVVDRARREGFDLLIVQDADEFLLPEEYEANIAAMCREPQVPYFRNRWHLFWKSPRHVIVNRLVMTYRAGRPVTFERNVMHEYCMAFALNLRTDVRFAANRMPTHLDDYVVLPGFTQHFSFVFSDEEIMRKISTWGHTRQIYDHQLWYRVKWLGWTESTRNLSPMSPTDYARAVPFTGRLVDEMRDFQVGPQAYVPPNWRDRMACAVHETRRRVRSWARLARGR